MNYKEVWTFLDNLQFFKIKLGLDSMRMFLEELGSPEKELKFVHVAGTNGKGSVAATLLTLLSKAGYSVGLYTSPHLSSVRERFRINDQYISEKEFAEEGTRIHNILGDRQITYFEFTTALALLWFARRKVDLAILEVGLGGRLDATNVITPLLSVITNVSMDHEMYLGNTLAEIAGEKAGIIKKGIPVVSGVGTGATEEERIVLSVVERVCNERKAPLFLHGRDFFVEPTGEGRWDYWAMKRKGCCQLREKIKGLSSNLKGKYRCSIAAWPSPVWKFSASADSLPTTRLSVQDCWKFPGPDAWSPSACRVLTGSRWIVLRKIACATCWMAPTILQGLPPYAKHWKMIMNTTG